MDANAVAAAVGGGNGGAEEADPGGVLDAGNGDDAAGNNVEAGIADDNAAGGDEDAGLEGDEAMEDADNISEISFDLPSNDVQLNYMGLYTPMVAAEEKLTKIQHIVRNPPLGQQFSDAVIARVGALLVYIILLNNDIDERALTDALRIDFRL